MLKFVAVKTQICAYRWKLVV